MKALIVDDEQHVREAVRYFIPWAELGIEAVLEATNGKEAMDTILMEQPEIIFTDMRMPFVDGVQLLEWIHHHSPGAKTIVISGYEDFNYVKPTVVYGGMDYLLKPLDPRQLVSAAERAVQAWKLEEEVRKQAFDRDIQINVLRPLYWDKGFSDLVSGARTYRDMSQQLEEQFGLQRRRDSCRVAVISFEHADRRFIDRLNGDMQLISFVTTNVCNEVLEHGKLGYAFRYWHGSPDIVILFWADADRAEEWIDKMNSAFDRTYQVRYHVGLGNVSSFPEGLSLSFEQAKKALRQRNLLGARNWIHPYAAESEGTDVARAFAEFAEKLKFAVLSGSREKVNAAVREWHDRVRTFSVITQGSIEQWQEEFDLLLLRWTKEMVGDNPALEDITKELPFDEAGEFSLSSWVDIIEKRLLKLMQGCAYKQNRDTQLVDDIKNYVETNYHREITLQDIAERFFISRENVSRKFKQVSDENLSDYVAKLRIDKAKKLLDNPAMRLSQIADMVGFQDEKYFSRVFKKMTGLSPRDYRRQ